MIAIGYARVSTTGQVEDGVSLDAQQERLRAWATAHGYELRATEVDAGLSGGRADNRPALQRALDAVCKGKGVLVVYSLSRLARSTRDALEIAERLHKSGANLVSLSESIDTTSAMGRFFFTLLAALAALERDLISERTKMAMAHKRSLKQYTGGEAPYGWRAEDGQLVEDEDEQRVIRMIESMARGGNSVARIAHRLNEALTPCRGSAWHARSVGRILAAQEKIA
jgi:site-specific DNA recombinase